jgi:hypothetical protein
MIHILDRACCDANIDPQKERNGNNRSRTYGLMKEPHDVIPGKEMTCREAEEFGRRS